MQQQSFKVVEINLITFFIFFVVGMAWVVKELYYGLDLKIGFNPFQITLAGLFIFGIVGIFISTFQSVYTLSELGIERKIKRQGLLAFPKSKNYQWEDFYLIFTGSKSYLFTKQTTFYIANQRNLKCTKLILAKDDYDHFVRAVPQFAAGKKSKNRPTFGNFIFNEKLMGIMGIIGFIGIGILYFNLKNGFPGVRPLIVMSLPLMISLIYWISLIRKMRK